MKKYQRFLRTWKCLLFQEISNSLNQLVNKYQNISFSGNLSINFLDCKHDVNNHFSVLRDIYDITSLANATTSYENLKCTI